MNKSTLLKGSFGGLIVGAAAFLMSWCNAHGISLELLGADPATVKDALTGIIATTFISLSDVTAKGVVDKIVAMVKFVRRSFARISNAAHEPIESEEK